MRALVAVLALVAASGTQSVIADLPVELAGYPAWETLSRRSYRVPFILGFLCRIATSEEVSSWKKESGPHSDWYVLTYANPLAIAAIDAKGETPFPAGAILAKAKFKDPEASHTDGLAFMIKHPSGEFIESGGWEFRYLPDRPGASVQHCIECHRDGRGRDYVFGRRLPSPY